MIDLRRVIFLVDGRTELMSLSKKFDREYRVRPDMRMVLCNGKDVSPKAYASASFGTLSVALRGPWLQIVCIVDREGRQTTGEHFAAQLLSAIIDEVTARTKYHEDELCRKLRVCVPDRMFENWILADVEGIKACDSLVKAAAVQKNYDGTHGTNELQLILRTKYNKTIHAQKMFSFVSFQRGKTNSVSFNTFTSAIDL